MAKRKYQCVTYASEYERTKINEHLVDAIVSMLKGIEANYDKCWSVNRVKYRYALGQAIRQYLIPEANWHLSVAAKDLWEKITDDNIRLFFYDEEFIVKKDLTKEAISTYKGANAKNIEELTLDPDIKKYKFTSLFVCEHTTPVADIIGCLKKLKDGDIKSKNVKKILDKIHITRMLRTEDRENIRDSEVDSQKKVSRGRLNKLKIDLKDESSEDLFDKLKKRFYSKILLAY